jgi:hypothetical protein
MWERKSNDQDLATASYIRNVEKCSVDNTQKQLQKNDDGSVDIYFGPKAPKGKESNWVQTLPGKSFNLLYRMYGPLEPWFDKTWKLGDFELLE